MGKRIIGRKYLEQIFTILGGLASIVAKARPGNLRLANVCGLVARWAGDTRSLRGISRHCLWHLSKSPDELTKQLANRSPRAAPPRLSNDILLEALREFQGLMERVGAEPFLVFGSLLGPIRDQRFIPGDGDLDLGILGRGQFKKAVDAIRKSRSFRIKRIRKFNAEPTKMEVHHTNGAKLDIKRFLIEPDGGVSWYTNNVSLTLKKFYPKPFRLKKMQFNGSTIKVPADAEDFLEWQYGDWKTPDSYYSMITSGPLHSAEHRNFVDASGPFAILRAMLFNRRPQSFQAQVQSMAKLFPRDELWPASDAAILQAFEQLDIEPVLQTADYVAR
jgi:hypothetical protein